MHQFLHRSKVFQGKPKGGNGEEGHKLKDLNLSDGVLVYFPDHAVLNLPNTLKWAQVTWMGKKIQIYLTVSLAVSKQTITTCGRL